MIKKCVYTVMSLVLAVSFVFGSMYLINELFKISGEKTSYGEWKSGSGITRYAA